MCLHVVQCAAIKFFNVFSLHGFLNFEMIFLLSNHIQVKINVTIHLIRVYLKKLKFNLKHGQVAMIQIMF